LILIYRGYEIREENNKVYVDNVKDFDPVHIFESGQCFRWKKEQDGSFTGIAMDRVVNVRKDGNAIIIDNATVDDFIRIWFDYFDLGIDYSAIKEILSKDDIMRRAISFGEGIRLLKQDLWEVVISFIISANNNIPRITKIINAISAMFGKQMNYKGKVYYTFPEIDALANAEVDKIAECRAGYRCSYIVKTAHAISNGEFDLTRLKNLGTGDAKKELLKLPGVGPKVADCILLFSGTKFDVFPVDVWVARVMKELYFGYEPGKAEIMDMVQKKFGSLAGYAQQYLFYYARENKIGGM
jgi:N-glycosylase/DNA lyase